jgi:hypothetical protein
MEVSPISLLQMLLAALAMGGELGALCDLYKGIWMFLGAYDFSHHPNNPVCSKLKIGIKQTVAFFGDVFFFLISAGMIVVLNYTYNDGKMRIYTGISLFLGYFIYRKSIGKLVIFGVEHLAFLMKRIFLFVFLLLFYPFRLFYSFFLKKLRKIIRKN